MGSTKVPSNQRRVAGENLSSVTCAISVRGGPRSPPGRAAVRGIPGLRAVPSASSSEIEFSDDYPDAMAGILAYGSPALGHLLPVSTLLRELAGRGHDVHLRLGRRRRHG